MRAIILSHATAGGLDVEEAKHELDQAFAKLDTLTKVVKRTISGAAARLAKHEREWETRYFKAEAQYRDDLGELAAAAISDAFDPNGFFVYILWGEDESKPLYVGQSTNILARLGNHMQNNDRRHLVRKVRVIRCRSERHMDDTECRLIAKFQPTLNVTGIRRTDGIPA